VAVVDVVTFVEDRYSAKSGNLHIDVAVERQ
jgi:hypothetical protein